MCIRDRTCFVLCYFVVLLVLGFVLHSLAFCRVLPHLALSHCGSRRSNLLDAAIEAVMLDSIARNLLDRTGRPNKVYMPRRGRNSTAEGRKEGQGTPCVMLKMSGMFTLGGRCYGFIKVVPCWREICRIGRVDRTRYNFATVAGSHSTTAGGTRSRPNYCAGGCFRSTERREMHAL